MKISERIFSTLEDWQAAWKERLKGWMADVLSFGFDVFFKVLGKSFAPKLKPLIDSIEAKTTIPPELKPLFDEMKEPTGEVAALFAQSVGGSLLGGAISKLIDFFLRPLTLGMSYVPDFMILDPPQLLALWRRNFIDESYLDTYLHLHGLGDDDIKQLKSLTEIRLDPMSWVTAFRRKYEDFAKIEDDLKHQGWNEDRIKALKFTTLFIPTADEQTLWLAREVYEPLMVDRYGLGDELPVYEDTDFDQVGVTPAQMANKWAAHWEHASFMQVIEMLHRGTLSLDREMPEPPSTKGGWATRDAEGEEALYDWYRLVEIPPFWRDRLTAMSWNVPTRVDVRRWWDMRTIDEAELYNVYHRQGYHGKDLDNYVLWTKVYVAFPDLVARFKNGWIAEDEVKSELVALGMSADRVEEMWQTKFKEMAPAQVEEERKATATEIMKGVKNEVITWGEGVEMLGDLGYSAETADFKLTVYGAVASGSPETYEEYKDLTQKWRKAVGMEAKPVTEEMLNAAQQLIGLRKEVDSLKAAIKAEEGTLIEEEGLPEAATKKRDELRVSLHRAEAELQRVKTEYDGLVAQWRHGE